MKTVYVDSNYLCHTKNDGTMEAVETGAFDELCDGAVECYRLIPEGRTWRHPDGFEIRGLFIQPAVPVSIPDAIQKQHETDKSAAADMAAALEILGVTP